MRITSCLCCHGTILELTACIVRPGCSPAAQQCFTATACIWSSSCESHPCVQDIVFSFPVECKGGRWSIVQGLQIDDYTAGKLKATGEELVEEKALALQCLEEQS